MRFVRWGSQCHRRKLQYKEGRKTKTAAEEPVLPHKVSGREETTVPRNGAKGKKGELGGELAKHGLRFR